MTRFFAMLILCFWGAAANAASDPSGALDEINAALADADATALEEALDLDALIGQGLDEFMRRIKKPDAANAFPPMLALMFAKAGEGEALRGLLREEARAFILNGVSSGAFGGKKNGAASRGLLAPLFAQASMGRKSIVAKGDPAPVDGGWIMPFTARDDGNGQDYEIMGRFRRESDGRTRLCGIENMGALFERIARENE